MADRRARICLCQYLPALADFSLHVLYWHDKQLYVCIAKASTSEGSCMFGLMYTQPARMQTHSLFPFQRDSLLPESHVRAGDRIRKLRRLENVFYRK